ncbi:hypothetical protein LCGC14_0756890 [marine sediment metagenome]|uniref:Uncharacterized protein n=1 Tax=marine sediment metagenome TaxID=412755 RepID=A0A0F9Q6G1_9ZZZZ
MFDFYNHPIFCDKDKNILKFQYISPSCWQYKTHMRCLKCKHKDFNNFEALGTCKLLTCTILKAPSAESHAQNSYALGVVEFENGIKKLGQITTQENLKNGIELKPIYKKYVIK